MSIKRFGVSIHPCLSMQWRGLNERVQGKNLNDLSMHDEMRSEHWQEGGTRRGRREHRGGGFLTAVGALLALQDVTQQLAAAQLRQRQCVALPRRQHGVLPQQSRRHSVRNCVNLACAKEVSRTMVVLFNPLEIIIVGNGVAAINCSSTTVTSALGWEMRMRRSNADREYHQQLW